MLSELEAAALTTMVLSTVVVFPAESETEYLIMYVPGVAGSTIPPLFPITEVVIELVKSPSTSSVAVAPGLYTPPRYPQQLY